MRQVSLILAAKLNILMITVSKMANFCTNSGALAKTVTEKTPSFVKRTDFIPTFTPSKTLSYEKTIPTLDAALPCGL